MQRCEKPWRRPTVASLAAGMAVILAACGKPADNQAKAPADTGAGNAASAPASPPAPVAAPTPPPAMPVPGSERSFVNAAALSGLAELEAARYVAGKTSNDVVRSYAQMLEREHNGANEELRRIADGKGITLPTVIEGEHMTRLDKLKSQDHGALDADFIQFYGIDGHNRAIELFEREAREGQDPELRAYAERTLPKLREHLGRAQQIQGKKAGG